MHIKAITKSPMKRASIRDTLEVVLLFVDVVSSVIGIIRKEPLDGHDDHDDHGHTH